jgi:pimeloyl-ACP methyl ester carboxylesterase
MFRSRFPWIVLAVCWASWNAPWVSAQTVAGNDRFAGDSVEANLDPVPTPTLGGMQFWSDELLFRDWRIQRHAVSGQYRLLDGNNLRRAGGTFEQCRAALESIKREQRFPSQKKVAVLVLHGLGDTRGRMASLCKALERSGRYAVFNVAYASTRRSIADHAGSLASIVEHLDGIEEIHLVGFSLGNIVIRRYLADEIAKHPDRPYVPRLQRIVMIGPPNHGAELATSLGKTKTFSLILGKSADELGEYWVWAESSLATPPCEFGIIAGGLGNDGGFNPLLPGDDDGIVTVASTRLRGAADFVLVPKLHSQLPKDAKVHEYVMQFLEHGRFNSDGHRQMVSAE